MPSFPERSGITRRFGNFLLCGCFIGKGKKHFAIEPFCSSGSGALAALAIPTDRPCDDACADRIEDWAETRMNDEFMAQIKALQGAKIDTLLVDIAGNGGGTEWADAAARMLTSIRLRSPRIGFMRGAHWAKKFGEC